MVQAAVQAAVLVATAAVAAAGLNGAAVPRATQNPSAPLALVVTYADGRVTEASRA